MKKRIKRLALTKETISSLDNPGLEKAFGGWGTIETECCASMQPCSIVNCHTDTSPVPSGWEQ
jgi:hypothetical protein